MAEKALACNLKGYGPVRLSKLPDDELKAVAVALHVDPSSTSVIADILKAKRFISSKPLRPANADNADNADAPLPSSASECAPAISEAAAPATAPPAAPAAAPATAPAAAPATALAGESTMVVVKQPAFKITAFNSYKLRMGEKSLAEQWLHVIGEMSTSNVVMASEVPYAQVDERASTMRHILEQVSGCSWTTTISQPSGTQNEKSNKEVHVVWARDGVKIKKHRTLQQANGVRLDYAPFQFAAEDSHGVNYIMTSVHFPPESRKAERDRQISAFLTAYAQTSEARMETPFTSKGARDGKLKETVHIIGGDFNAFPPHVAHAECIPFSTFIGHRVATSAGMRSHDHFMVNADSADKYLIGADVIQLATPHNSRTGQSGVSDHFPISLTIRYAAQTRTTATR